MAAFDEVNGNETDIINERLRSLKTKSKTCYVISEDESIDQLELEVDEALNQTLGSSIATILVFGDAEMIYFEGDPPKNRFISKL